jgi:acyl carrier protein
MSSDLESYIARREAVLERVRKLLVERLHVERDPDTIDPDTPLFGTGLGLDSVDAVEMVVSLEDTFGLKLPDDALGRRVMRTVGKLVDLVIACEEAPPAAPEGASAEGQG